MKQYDTARIKHIPTYPQITAAKALVKLKHDITPIETKDIPKAFDKALVKEGMKRCMALSDLRMVR